MADSPPKNQETGSLLTEGETEQLRWQGLLKEGEDNEHQADFVATDQRLIISLGKGHFKDIGFNHVESVEVTAEEESEMEGTNPRAIIVLGSMFAIMGVLAMILGGFSGAATFAGLGAVGLGIYGVWYGTENYEELEDGFEVTEYRIFHIVLRTAADSQFAKPIYLETKDNVGPELSKLVRKSQ